MICFMKKNARFCCCHDYKCHHELFFDWIVFKYLNDPNMMYVTKGHWRYVLYSEYFSLANYRRYRQFVCEGKVEWPWNIFERGLIPPCIELPLQQFIDIQYSRQVRQWHKDKIDNLLHEPEMQKVWKEMSVEQIEEKFEMMIKVRNTSRKEMKEDKAFDKRQVTKKNYIPKPTCWFFQK